jgi:LysM repeat protein
MKDQSKPIRLDQTRAGSDARDGLAATTHLGHASLQEVRHLNPVTTKTEHLPAFSIDVHSHTVKKGETLSGIAQEHLSKGASTHDIYAYVKKLVKLNHIIDADKIRPGQVINFSKDGSPSDAPQQPAKPGNPATPGAQPKADTPQPSPAPKPEVTQPPSDAPQAPAPSPQPGAADKPAAPKESGFMSFVHKTEAVASDIAHGAVDEVIHHPGEVIKNVAIGAAIAVGAALAAPELAIGAAVVGIGLGAYEVATHAGGWIHAGEVVANPDGHSAAEQKAAHDTLHGVGGGLTEIAAGFAGGGLGTWGLKAATAAIASEASAAVGVARTAEAGAGRAATTGESAEAAASRTAGKAGADAGNGLRSLENVKIKSPSPNERVYDAGGKQYDLRKSPGDSWFYGKNTGSGDIKIHVNVSGPLDLARVQRVLIPFLKDNPEANRLASAWKTFDPEDGFASPREGGPSPEGQNAKGFTIYAKTAEQLKELQALIDKELANNGLSTEPIKTGNVDIVEGQSGRVGTVRDMYSLTRDSAGNTGADLGDELAGRIQAKFGHGQKLSESELRAAEKKIGIEDDTLTYDRNGKLMLKVRDVTKPRNGKVYVDESGANKTPGALTDRPAMYAIAKFFGMDPINL